MGDRRANIQVTAALYRHEADGSKVLLQEVENDLAVDNFLKWFTALLSPQATATVSITVDEKDASGTDRTLNIYQTSASGLTFANNTGSPRVMLEVGDGSGSAVTPARADFKLVNSLVSVQAGSASRVVNVITIAAGFVAPSSFTAREVGMAFDWQDSGATRRSFLMFHDSVTVSLTSGVAYSVAYTFTMP